jgi:hypothetical protein
MTLELFSEQIQTSKFLHYLNRAYLDLNYDIE